MLSRIREMFALSEDGDELEQRVTTLFCLLLIALATFSFVFTIVLVARGEQLIPTLTIFVFFQLVLGVTFLLLRANRVMSASYFFLVIAWAVVTAASLYTGGIENPGINNYILLVIIAGVLVGGPRGVANCSPVYCFTWRDPVAYGYGYAANDGLYAYFLRCDSRLDRFDRCGSIDRVCYS